MPLSISFLKVMGALCILFGSGCFGYTEVRKEQSNISVLRQIVAFLQFMEQQVRYGKDTLAEMMNTCAKEPLGIMSVVCKKMSRYLQDNRWVSPKEGWEKVISGKELQDQLEQTELEHLIGLMDCFYANDPSHACKLIQKELDFFQERLKFRKNSAEEKGKMMLKISLMAGLFVCIVLW